MLAVQREESAEFAIEGTLDSSNSTENLFHFAKIIYTPDAADHSLRLSSHADYGLMIEGKSRTTVSPLPLRLGLFALAAF